MPGWCYRFEMGILADHEGLYDGSRIIPALVVAVGLHLLAGVFAAVVWRRCGRPSVVSWPGRLIGLGLLATLLAMSLGVVPRATRSGYNICGPVFHFSRVDSKSCDGVLSPLPTLVLIAVIAAFVLFVAALVSARRLMGNGQNRSYTPTKPSVLR